MNAASLQAIATSVAQERVLATVLKRIVTELAAQAQVALTRIWLTNPGDRCAACKARPHCADQSQCLHLAASAGTPLAPARAADWSRIDGALARVPLARGKVGQIGATGESVLLEDVAADQRWIFDQKWAREEGIVSFAGHPLVFRGQTLGVLAVFSREQLGPADFAWLRAFADTAAVAIANARAFEEIERLRRELESENRYLRQEVNEAYAVDQIVGRSAPLAKVLEQIELVAPTTASVLILGESGTGKELVARAIHERSPRAARPLVKVNCAAIPRELFESEFFGHVHGAFTGATRDRVGRFLLAHRGTLFLDEIGELPLDLQAKLLRVLQEGYVEPVGDDQSRAVDVRVIAASNRDLSQEVLSGRFRRDLYYRLSVFPIEVTPLRERVEDIPALAEHFVRRLCRQWNRPIPTLGASALKQLERYPWPGNVRELQNVIERALISARGGRLQFDRLADGGPARPSQRESDVPPSAPEAPALLTRRQLRQAEQASLRAALAATNGLVYGPRGAAALLGMRPTTLASRLKALGIRKPR